MENSGFEIFIQTNEGIVFEGAVDSRITLDKLKTMIFSQEKNKLDKTIKDDYMFQILKEEYHVEETINLKIEFLQLSRAHPLIHDRVSNAQVVHLFLNLEGIHSIKRQASMKKKSPLARTSSNVATLLNKFETFSDNEESKSSIKESPRIVKSEDLSKKYTVKKSPESLKERPEQVQIDKPRLLGDILEIDNSIIFKDPRNYQDREEPIIVVSDTGSRQFISSIHTSSEDYDDKTESYIEDTSSEIDVSLDSTNYSNESFEPIVLNDISRRKRWAGNRSESNPQSETDYRSKSPKSRVKVNRSSSHNNTRTPIRQVTRYSYRKIKRELTRSRSRSKSPNKIVNSLDRKFSESDDYHTSNANDFICDNRSSSDSSNITLESSRIVRNPEPKRTKRKRSLTKIIDRKLSKRKRKLSHGANLSTKEHSTEKRGTNRSLSLDNQIDADDFDPNSQVRRKKRQSPKSTRKVQFIRKDRRSLLRKNSSIQKKLRSFTKADVSNIDEYNGHVSPSLPQYYNTSLFSTVKGYWIESGNYSITHTDVNLSITPQSYDNMWYNLHFMNEEHENYVGYDKHMDPYVLSIKYESVNESIELSALLRTKKGDISGTFQCRKETKYNAKQVVTELDRKIIPKKIKLVRSKSIINELNTFESNQSRFKYKFGILYCAEGQTTEEEMFGNEHGSEQFNNFLNLMGDHIQLQGFEGYRAGLDVKYNSTGETSYYKKWGEFEIMYHVSTLLPFSSESFQQLDRKRHLGNDIVTIIFKEGNTPYKPNTIASSFNQSFIIVQPVEVNGSIWYRVACAYKDHMIGEKIKPEIPVELIPHHDYLRDFLLCKAINSERNAIRSGSLQTSIESGRSGALTHIYETYM
eukprot:TRINITY_DN6284_c0_g6_i1.p1 TRINITY_DN6284_c0_g6~~TRINITY_DN6284_c0_g6_i1.p1  ORF type:complete len:892 (-),score=166.17 TRINITY_DN6284_c0_g6_i1:2262-4850(-)